MTQSTTISGNVLEPLAADLGRRVQGGVRFDPFTRTLYSTDASIYQIVPLGVVFPRTVEDVIAAVEIAAQYGVPVLPRGGGTSQAGQAVGAALVIDFTRHLNDIVALNVEEQRAKVQPGLVLAQLNRRAAGAGLEYGLTPSSGDRATVGGSVGNNASGSYSILYGMTVDHVHAISCVLADGTTTRFEPLEAGGLAAKQKQKGLEGEVYRGLERIIAQYRTAIETGYPRTWRRAGGYNLDRMVGAGPLNVASLITGSEGTLAVITEVELGLVPRPARTGLLVIHFDRLLDALAATPRILDTDPAAVELMDNVLLDLTRAVPSYAPKLDFVEGRPEALLVVEYFGEDQREVVARLNRLEEVLAQERIGGARVRALDPAHIAQVWGVRKAGLGLLASIKGDFKPVPFIEDAAVPVEHLADYIGDLQQLLAENDTRLALYAHASAGLLHARPLLNLKDPEGVERLQTIAEESMKLVVSYDGAISGEHGDGLSRSCFNEQVFGPVLYQAFREVKNIFDPDGLMNPGKIVDPPPMADNLRYGPDYRTIYPDTVYDFTREQGFDRAVELCNGTGVCRRLETGTMCPSYRATRDEEHSTRGRANLLRAAMSGVLPPGSLTSQRMKGALDLCLECKACKAECPTGVDMAKIKAEWLYHYHQTHGTPTRSRVFSQIHTISKMGSALAPLSDWMAQWGPLRWLMERIVGIDRRRALPRHSRESFERWFRRHGTREHESGDREAVVLFHDTFMTYHEPEIGKAATRLLQAAGYDVLLVEDRVCCGRPMISQGLLDNARVNAARNVSLLEPLAARGVPIIGCEPSCLLTIQDDYPDLVPGPAARAVADATQLLEEFLAEQIEAGRLTFPAKGTTRQMLVHGHCYQKALSGTESLKSVLSAPDGYSVEEIPSGCCGMAGSFGYANEHYDLSLQIGEISLFPAVRDAGKQTEIVASGISCRQQIAHGTGRAARHPALVLEDALLAPSRGR